MQGFLFDISHCGLKFVSSGPRYSTYQVQGTGEIVYLANGGMTRLVSSDALPRMWQEFVDNGQVDAEGYHVDRDEWFDSVRDSLLDPNTDIFGCQDCDEMVTEDNRNHVGNDGDIVCDDCIDNYSWCDDCEQYLDSNDMNGTLNETSVCDRCLRRNWTFCDYCDGYRQDDDWEHDHDENEGCDCEAPAQVFAVPHHGSSLPGRNLDNDDEIVMSLPAGTISDEGILAIQRLIHTEGYDRAYDERETLYTVAQLCNQIGAEWQTRQGNFTKRLSKAAYQQLNGYKISSELLGKIGSTAREHSADTTELTIAVTRDLNQSAESFGHEDSCWFQGGSYGGSRCALKHNGGYGLRSFGGSRYNHTSGRAWVMPLKLDGDELTPTFDTTAPDAFVVFNGYGDLSGYTAARIVAQMSSMTYRKIRFTANPMYINGDSGYLVTSEEIAQNRDNVRLHLDEHSSLFHNEDRAKETVDA